MTTSPEKTAHRVSQTGVDVDAVYRTLQMLNATKSCADPTRTIYQLGNCKVEVCDTAGTAALVVAGPTEEDALNGLAQLGYGPDRVNVMALHPRAEWASWLGR